jgi:hypothetical protein
VRSAARGLLAAIDPPSTRAIIAAI